MRDDDQDGDPRTVPLATPTAAGPGAIWFVGDLDDPWVAAIAAALQASTSGPVRLTSAAGPLPEGLFEGVPAPSTLILHRATLTRADAERVLRLRSMKHPPASVILCVGPHVRHADLERWGTFVDAIVPEGTAAEQVARLARGRPVERFEPGVRGSSARVAVVSTSAALRALLVEAVGTAGYEATEARDWDDAPVSGPALWDVPVLEPGWERALERRAAVGPVLALLGFADRALVTQARAHGATACLDLPFDLADLAVALERLMATAAPIGSGTRNEPAHPTPPPPSRLPRHRADRHARSDRTS